jgi:O-antigen biosynthesis protein
VSERLRGWLPWRSRPVRRAAWLNEHLLLLLVRTRRAHVRDVTAHVLLGETATTAKSHCLPYGEKVSFGWGRTDALIVLRLPDAGLAAGSRIELRSVSGTLAIDSAMLESALADLPTLLEQELATLAPQERQQVRRFVLSACADDLERPGGFSLAKALHLVRDALREPLPEPPIAKDEPQAVHVDVIVAADESHFWISGWTRDEDGTFDRLSVVSPEGQRADLDDVLRFSRPDVEEAYAGSGRPAEKHGFASFFALLRPSPLEGGWIAELRDGSGSGVQATAPPVVHDPAAARDLLLAQFTADRAGQEELRAKHLFPALTRLQERERRSVEIESVIEYGDAVASPTVSVIVPLYRRIDFLQHHLLHFAQDAAMRQAELIYVLDSPELARPLSELASAMHAFHGIPFRVMRLSRNAGYGIANNLGASIARGRVLLLLNSDVMPGLPGWLEQMVSFYDATSDIGALGPKLLFEDDSIQHAGMYFEREGLSGAWGDLHYFKGLSRGFPPANVTRPVPAVTGACLMIERALFEKVGGLSHLYLKGGYEDSDLCLRLIERGRRNWYLGEVELYHLEGQVHPTPAANATVKYATWLQTHLWGDPIERVMADDAMTPAAVAAQN